MDMIPVPIISLLSPNGILTCLIPTLLLYHCSNSKNRGPQTFSYDLMVGRGPTIVVFLFSRCSIDVLLVRLIRFLPAKVLPCLLCFDKMN